VSKFDQAVFASVVYGFIFTLMLLASGVAWWACFDPSPYGPAPALPAVAGLFSMFAVGMGWATIHCVNLARDEYRPSVLRRVSW
jgi:hypothetical protein